MFTCCSERVVFLKRNFAVPPTDQLVGCNSKAKEQGVNIEIVMLSRTCDIVGTAFMRLLSFGCKRAICSSLLSDDPEIECSPHTFAISACRLLQDKDAVRCGEKSKRNSQPTAVALC